jgi:hypothetical protein
MNKELSDQEKRIDEVLKKSEGWAVESKTVYAFLNHLTKNLQLPFEVINMEDDERYLLFGIEDSGDTMYGLTGNVKLLSDKRRKLVLALCDLEAIEKGSKNFELLDDYSVWFCNSQ